MSVRMGGQHAELNDSACPTPSLPTTLLAPTPTRRGFHRSPRCAANQIKQVRLAPRQRQVLGHLLKGLSEKEVATALSLSRHTVHVYIKQIYRLMEVTSRNELMAIWVRAGAQVERKVSTPAIAGGAAPLLERLLSQRRAVLTSLQELDVAIAQAWVALRNA